MAIDSLSSDKAFEHVHSCTLSNFYLVIFCQAVVVSIDPRRMYINSPEDVEFRSTRVTNPGICLLCNAPFHIVNF